MHYRHLAKHLTLFLRNWEFTRVLERSQFPFSYLNIYLSNKKCLGFLECFICDKSKELMNDIALNTITLLSLK